MDVEANVGPIDIVVGQFDGRGGMFADRKGERRNAGVSAVLVQEVVLVGLRGGRLGQERRSNVDVGVAGTVVVRRDGWCRSRC